MKELTEAERALTLARLMRSGLKRSWIVSELSISDRTYWKWTKGLQVSKDKIEALKSLLDREGK